MQTYTSTQARANIATVLDTALNGEPVEITRRDGRAAVLISKAEPIKMPSSTRNLMSSCNVMNTLSKR